MPYVTPEKFHVIAMTETIIDTLNIDFISEYNLDGFRFQYG